MNDTAQPRLVYDSERLPLWLRLPLVVLGVLLWVIWLDLVLERIAGVRFRLLISGPTTTPLGLIPALLAIGLLAFFFCNFWVARKRILVFPHSQLIVEDRWLLATHRSRISLSATERIEVRPSRRKSFWDIYLIAREGGPYWLTRSYSPSRANEIAHQIADAIAIVDDINRDQI